MRTSSMGLVPTAVSAGGPARSLAYATGSSDQSSSCARRNVTAGSATSAAMRCSENAPSTYSSMSAGSFSCAYAARNVRAPISASSATSSAVAWRVRRVSALTASLQRRVSPEQRRRGGGEPAAGAVDARNVRVGHLATGGLAPQLAHGLDEQEDAPHSRVA